VLTRATFRFKNLLRLISSQFSPWFDASDDNNDSAHPLGDISRGSRLKHIRQKNR
jgi:hypothetical protein